MSSRQKKITATAAAVILVLALGLAGTFASSESTDSSGNIEGDIETSIFLHDDFSKVWDEDVRDRDVYVENTGDTSLYIRMRLDEFMQYGGKKLVGGSKDLTDTWKPHIPAGKNAADCATEIHDYFTIQMGNDEVIWYKPQTKNAYDPAIAESDKTEMTSTAKIVFIEDYLKAEVKPDPCWILDPADGYAYWYTQLPSNETTGLILNSITNTGSIDESYYYGINVKAEAVTEMDLNAWFWGQAPKDSTTGEAFDQASTNAIRLLKNMSPKYIEITQDMKDDGAVDYDSDNDGYLTKKENADFEAMKGVTPVPDPDAGLNKVQKKVKATGVGKTVSIENASSSPYGTSTDWIVLSKTDEEATLITKKMVTVRIYHTSCPYPTWPKSDIRGWLNSAPVAGGTDYTTAGYMNTLGSDLKDVLKEENLKTAKAYNDWAAGNMTPSTDKVWMMTETGNDSSMVGKNPGDAAVLTKQQMMCSDSAIEPSKTADCCWLRSPRTFPPKPFDIGALTVNKTGIVYIDGGFVNKPYGVRPAVTITLK